MFETPPSIQDKQTEDVDTIESYESGDNQEDLINNSSVDYDQEELITTTSKYEANETPVTTRPTAPFIISTSEEIYDEYLQSNDTLSEEYPDNDNIGPVTTNPNYSKQHESSSITDDPIEEEPVTDGVLKFTDELPIEPISTTATEKSIEDHKSSLYDEYVDDNYEPYNYSYEDNEYLMNRNKTKADEKKDFSSNEKHLNNTEKKEPERTTMPSFILTNSSSKSLPPESTTRISTTVRI